MRVLHIIPSISRKRGGPSTAIINMVRALRKENIDASIITTCDYGTYVEKEYPLTRWFYIDEVPVLVFPSLDCHLKTLNEYLISPALSWWLLRNVASFDLLHIHAIFSYVSTTSMLVARMKGVPYIIRTIGQLNSWSLSQGGQKKRFMLALVEKRNLMQSLAIHVTSKSEMEDLRMICNHSRILELELGVELPHIYLTQKAPSNRITQFVFLSRVHPKKQLETFFKALYGLTDKRTPSTWRLQIAGDGDPSYLESLKKLAVTYGISDQITWMGHVSGAEKDLLLRNSDWYVLPSMTENFGISAVEALSYGVPVIITTDVGISEMVQKHQAGLVYERGSDRLLIELKTALRGASMDMRLAARSLAKEKFSWSSIGHKLAMFYRSSINEV